MDYVKVCAHCGNTFTTRSANAKYCSDSCRVSAFKSNARQSAKGEREKAAEKEDAAFRKENDARQAQLNQERQAKAAAGDPLARMMLAEKFSLEYWTAYQDYLLDRNPNDKTTVNEISIQDPNFPVLVMTMTDELGAIITERGK